MFHPLFEFFERNRPQIDADPAKWPAAWSTVQWTTYPRYHTRTLPPPGPLPSITLGDAILRRKSVREFSGTPLSAEKLSTLLYYSCGLITPSDARAPNRRTYPSGGGLYPIELYPLILRGNKKIPTGGYHYNVRDHSLEELPDVAVDEIPKNFHYPWVADATVILFFGFSEERSKPKYGNFSYKAGLIESGHISQNMYLVSGALGLKCSAVGGFSSSRVHELLGLDPIRESLFYTVVVGT